MINMLSNKQVYEKSEVDNELAIVNQTIDNTKDTLEAEIKEAVSTAFEYKGPCRYMGSYPVNTFPSANLCRKNDIIRWDNNTVIQITETGTWNFRVLTDIHSGWVFNLTESCVTDNAWVDEFGVTISENTSIAVVKLPSPVYGCIWGFDAFADAASTGFHVDDVLSLTSVNPVQNKVITAALNETAEWLARDMTTAEARAIIEDEMAQGE